jgi:hypothetical protein
MTLYAFVEANYAMFATFTLNTRECRRDAIETRMRYDREERMLND